MIVATITELEVIAIVERGVPNKESIAIKAKESVNLGQYGIMLGTYSHSNAAFPFQDILFWFGDGLVENGDWIFVNTGEGRATSSKTFDQQHNVYSLFWGKRTTVFANSHVVPILFRVDAVHVLSPPTNLPQIGR